jgi:maltoporin
MTKTKLFTALALAGLAQAASAAPPIEFSGYFRAGTGVNARGGTQVCYGLPGADTKWRLGNECDYVIEPNFAAKIASHEGSDWYVHFMPSVYRAWGGSEFQTSLTPGDQTVAGSGTTELVTRFGQVYAYGNKIAMLGNGKVWAGRRFYNRLQLGINDQFLENNDGDGAGIEDIELGGTAKLSFAFMMNPRDLDTANNNRFALPIRVTGIPTLPNGSLSVYVTPSAQLESRNQVTGVDPADQPKGIAVGLYQSINGTLGGNTLVGFKHDKQGEVKNTRLVVQQTGKLGAGTAWDLIGEYRLNTNNGIDSKWYSLGGRTDTHISGPLRFLVELGTDQVKTDGGPTRNMTKLTLAGAVSAGNEAGSRPTIRLFVTHAVWNEAARQTLSGRLAEVYADKKSGTSVGIQAESWW